MSATRKAHFDSQHGPNWHVIVGKGFATYATYEAKTYMFFYMAPLAFLLYRMGSQENRKRSRFKCAVACSENRTGRADRHTQRARLSHIEKIAGS